jgi:hypothetical protein
LIWALCRYWQSVPCQRRRGECRECYQGSDEKEDCFDQAAAELQAEVASSLEVIL